MRYFVFLALVRTDVSEENSGSIIRVTSIGELGTLSVISYRRRLQRNKVKKELLVWNTRLML
jgi:hypothetical protein